MQLEYFQMVDRSPTPGLLFDLALLLLLALGFAAARGLVRLCERLIGHEPSGRNGSP